MPKANRRKLDSKTTKYVLLGYGANQKGYRLYDINRMKVIHSRDVTFDENKVPDIPTGKELCPPYVELKVEEEPSANQREIPDSAETEEPEEANPEPTPPTQTPTESGPRRSTRLRQEPDRYSHSLALCSTEQSDPLSVAEAMSSSDSSMWTKPMEKEMESLHQNNVWDLVQLPSDRKVVGSKWVFKRKINANGDVERYKARLVAQGCTQRFGVDYEETFSPVVRFESIRMLMALGVQHNLQLHQMDVSTAFLNGALAEEVYMKQPEGFTEKGKEHLVCRLNRSIYGLKQSPRCWNQEMTDLGTLHYFLGVKVVQDLPAGTLWIG